jgi:pimeloyl-ACP methyl ester carboxylesterase/phosphatidylglycerophosphate synthase
VTRAVPDRNAYLDTWQALHGGYDPRGSRLVGPWLSVVYACARPLARLGVPPDVVTLLGAVVSGLVVLLCAAGGRAVLVAAFVVGASGLVDSLDGAVAVLTGRATAFGAVLDSVVDRISDGLYLVAFWVVGAPAWMCVVAGFLVLLQEYVRARATAVGMDDIGVVTIGERPTRVIVVAMFLLGAGIYVDSAARWAELGALASVLIAVVALGQLLVVVARRLRSPVSPRRCRNGLRHRPQWPATPAAMACDAGRSGATIRGMTESSRTRQFATAPDGRTLCFAEWGDPAGFPVVLIHGTPGGRLNRHWDDAVYAAVGARVITYDRPGYGESTRHPGRRVVDCVGDVAAIVDHLGIDRFSVSGGSGGGPHCLAVAARLGSRIDRARCVVGVAPYDADGLEWFDGMDPMNVTEFGWALAGEEVLVPELDRELREMGHRVESDPSTLLGDGWDLDESDRAALARPEFGTVIRESTADLVRGGVWGWVDDDLAFTLPWGFDLAEISVPVEVRYGAKDVLVPAAHGAWLGRHVPGATVVVEEVQGHLGDPDEVGELIRWLVTGTYSG